MQRIASMLLALLLLLGCTRTAVAQADTIGFGARVRVTATRGDLSSGGAQTTQVIEGVLVEVTDHAIAIRVDRVVDQVRINRSRVARLERAAGYRSRARKAALGALIGAASGAAVALATPCDGWFCGAGFRASGGGIWGAGAGGVVGVILPPAIRWVAVPTSALVADQDRSPFSPATDRHGPGKTRLSVMVGAGTAAAAAQPATWKARCAQVALPMCYP